MPFGNLRLVRIEFEFVLYALNLLLGSSLVPIVWYFICLGKRFCACIVEIL